MESTIDKPSVKPATIAAIRIANNTFTRKRHNTAKTTTEIITAFTYIFNLTFFFIVS